MIYAVQHYKPQSPFIIPAWMLSVIGFVVGVSIIVMLVKDMVKMIKGEEEA